MAANSSSSSSSIDPYNLNESAPVVDNYHSNTQHTKSSPSFDSTIPSLLHRTDDEYQPLDVKDALSYLDRVKLTFPEQPDVFHRFLDIMREFKTQIIDTPGVIERVSALFCGHTALICGFNTFLPPGYRIECTDDRLKVTTPSGITTIAHDQPLHLQPVELQHAVQFISKIKSRFDIATYKRFIALLESYQRGTIHDIHAQVESLFQGATDILQEFKMYLPVQVCNNKKRPKPDISAIEAVFFDNVKQHIGNQQTYLHFLRVLNLFTQQQIDANGLIDQCESYLGGNQESYDQLKLLVGYDENDRVIVNVPDISKVECGPSYRPVPISWKNQVCSGRDELCWEVLNDEYVSHPTWASEDSGFIASKKNEFEEALHRVEEERYDYDLNIDATLNTLRLLEPISKRLRCMSESEKKAFKMPPGLGGQSISIYQRVIRKVYGDEKGIGIIDMLHNNPAQIAPVVVKRLKQKEDEWRKSQREWSEIWREVEIKNYYKALDYQSMAYKSNDRKITSIRYLVNEIEALRVDQLADHIHAEPQMTFEMKDKDVLHDVKSVLYSYLDRQLPYKHAEINSIKAFIEMIVPMFFDDTDSAREHCFLGNVGLYCFFRLFQMCYERLLQMKQVDIDYKTNGDKAKLMSRTALESNISTEILESIEMDFKEGYYETLLNLIDRFFSNEIEQTVFEECTRYLFGLKAYVMFTIDKLIALLTRQLHCIVTNAQAQEILSFYKKHHEQQKKTPGLVQVYRIEVTEVLGDNDDLYNMTFDTQSCTFSIQLLDKYDGTLGLDNSDKYTEYLKNYTNLDIDTPNVDRKRMNRTFLSRNISYCQDEHDIVVKSDLQYKICKNTYHMFYVINTEDSFINMKRKKVIGV